MKQKKIVTLEYVQKVGKRVGNISKSVGNTRQKSK